MKKAVAGLDSSRERKHLQRGGERLTAQKRLRQHPEPLPLNAQIFGWEKHANKTAQTEGYISFSKRANDGANWELFVFFEKNVEILAYFE